MAQQQMVEQIGVDEIVVSKQVRSVVGEKGLNELSESIKNIGLIEPIVCRREGDVIHLKAGQRRLEAAKMAGLKKISVIFREGKSAGEDWLIQLTENLQREEMNDLDIAYALVGAINETRMTIPEMAAKISKSVAFIKQHTQLLKLSDEVQSALRNGEIEFSGARALLPLTKEEQVAALIAAIAEEKEIRKKNGSESEKYRLLEVAEEEEEESEEEEEDEGETEGKAKKTTSKKPAKKSAKAKKAAAAKPTKASTKTIKRQVTKKKAEKEGKAAPKEKVVKAAATKKSLTEEFIALETNGQGLNVEEGYSATDMRQWLGKFFEFLGTKKLLKA